MIGKIRKSGLTRHWQAWALMLCWPPASGALTGRVLDRAGQPVAGAAVNLEGLSLSGVTDAQGRFSLGTVRTRGGTSAHRPSPPVRFRESLWLFESAPGSAGSALFTAGGRRVEAGERARMRALAKSMPVADTLALAKASFLPRRIHIAATDADLGDIVLYPVFTGSPGSFRGFAQYDFTVAGRNALVVLPKKAATGAPWIWRTYFWAHKPLFDSILCARGFALAFLEAPDLFGAPAAVALMDSLYRRLVAGHGFNPKPVLVGISRGGLYAYNWALPNLDKVSCIYGDGAVMDFVSWPCGCYGTGAGSGGNWTNLKSVYGFTGDAQAKAYRGNPYQNMKPFALARVPLINVYGETDDVVPAPENCLRANDSLKAYGWQMKLLPKPNTGHVHGVTAADGGRPGQLDTLVNFVLRHGGR